MIGNSIDKTNFPYKLILTDRKVSKLCKTFANNPLANIRLSQTQLFKILQSGRFLGRLLELLPETGLPLMKNVLKPLAKNVNIAIINSISSRFRNPCKFFSSATRPSDYAHQIMWKCGNE